MIKKKKMRTAYFLPALFGLFLTLSCAKEWNDYHHFTFNPSGGVQIYDTDIDGATIVIEIDRRRSKPAYFSEDLADEGNSYWFVEWKDVFTDWIYVRYKPDWGERGQLWVSVHENMTRQKRKARVTADKRDGGQFILDIKQND